MIETELRDQKLWARTRDLTPWDKNAKVRKESDLIRLMIQLFELDQYKPSVITQEGVVLGGMGRLQGYKRILGMDPRHIVDFIRNNLKREISLDEAIELQKKYEWTYVSIVNPENEAKSLKYNYSDNDQTGHYVFDLVKELSRKFDIDLSHYGGQFKPTQTFQEALNRVAKPNRFEIIISCSDEADVNDKLARIAGLGITARQRKKKNGSTESESAQSSETASPQSE